MITVSMTNEEAILFKKFQQVYSTFKVMDESGIFNIRNGSAEVHFDFDGNVREISRHDKLYKK